MIFFAGDSGLYIVKFCEKGQEGNKKPLFEKKNQNREEKGKRKNRKKGRRKMSTNKQGIILKNCKVVGFSWMAIIYTRGVIPFIAILFQVEEANSRLDKDTGVYTAGVDGKY